MTLTLNGASAGEERTEWGSSSKALDVVANDLRIQITENEWNTLAIVLPPSFILSVLAGFALAGKHHPSTTKFL